MRIFAVCAPGLEPVLLDEVRALGFSGRDVPGGVEVEGELQAVMRLNLWLRTATRVLVRVGEFKATAFPELIKKAAALPWERFVQGTVDVRATCRKSRLYHSKAVEERVHEAIEQRVRRKLEKGGQLVVARFEHDVCTLSVDSSGDLLHQRGYRGPQAKAPLRETLAAALLLAAGWRGETPLCDPLCGSGTIPIEGALIAAGRPPGLNRHFAFETWEKPGHPIVRSSERPSNDRVSLFFEASDQDAGAIAATRENAAKAGVILQIAQRPLAQLPPADGPGLIACNPPYGVRVQADLRRLFRDLGEAAKRRPLWDVAVITADESAAQAAGLPWKRLLRTQNGGIPVHLLLAKR